MSIGEKLTAVAENQQKVYTAGKQAQLRDFWDTFQEQGTRNDYSYAFQRGWTDALFRPKYPIVTTTLSYMFKSTGIRDLTAALEESGVTLDTSGATTDNYAFFDSCLERIPEISTLSLEKLNYTFYSNANLHTIDKVILKEDGSQTFSYAFNACPALENIVIEGCIGNNLSFAQSVKLTHRSLMSILTHLKDMSGTGQTRTLALGSKNLAKLTDTEKAMATEKGWTLL